ncbi:hypothetical protein SDC9_197448 [bioreactor metagenome]|uniref:Uncharacterized protein n=1 Tax=bioreactor metagenome TaxID=1076179 RepID=A0A645IFU0_9ZZZZ
MVDDRKMHKTGAHHRAHVARFAYPEPDHAGMRVDATLIHRQALRQLAAFAYFLCDRTDSIALFDHVQVYFILIISEPDVF